MFPSNSCFLLVDDSSSVRALVKQQLLTLGFNSVLESNNGKAAMEQLESLNKKGKQIALIIADWNMPEMTGIDLVRKLKKTPSFKDIPFLMITSEGESEKVVEAIVSGVNDFIIKPFDETILSEKLSAIWKRIATSG